MVATRHGEGRDAEETGDAAASPPKGRRELRNLQHRGGRQQQRHDEASSGDEGLSEGPDEASEGPSAADLAEDGADAAAEDAGTGGRSARAGRSLRDTIKKPPPSHLIQTFTRQPTPPPALSRAERRQQQRERERRERRHEQQRQLELQEAAQQQQELQVALRAAAAGSHLTRLQTRLLKQWAERVPGIDPETVDAAAGGDVEASEALASAAAEAIADSSQPGSDADADSDDDGAEGGSSEEELAEGSGEDAEEDADGSDEADLATASAGTRGRSTRHTQSQAAAAAGRSSRGLKGELQKLMQAAAQAEAAERRRRFREAKRKAAREQRLLQEQRGLGGSRRRSHEDAMLEYSSDEEGLGLAPSSDQEGDGGESDKVGRRLRKRRRTTWSGGSDGEDDDGDDDEDGGGRSKKKYKLRSRDRTAMERPDHNRPSHTAARPRSHAAERHRGHGRLDRQPRRRGGFSELSSDDDDGALFPGGQWNKLLAACSGPTGAFYAPSTLPPTPAAAAVAAAATAAATGLLSPRASMERRGSAFLDAGPAPGTASRAVGSGWGHWAPAAGAAVGDGLASGSGGAAAAGGTAAEKRGAGLGQELITPLQVDPSIDFDQIGGLDQYLSALKEMVFLPLLYPEIFDKFGVNPPRGVLFHGPPGTGKTLVARALAAQASRAAGQKVSFYMRKGADLLSKWVGEAEKQLRLLFEEASKHQPAIIFFDEIDGLAPVRTSKQDQVHNSIVSTLLALMDGLESRGRVVLIGATNRPDALDPALRRPGRFDRELLFPMPDLAARRSILAIHSRHWSPPPAPELLDDLAQRTGGYCGADLRALCAEASLAALRRVYPQIYASDIKLQIDPSAVHVARQDFLTAMKDLTPAAHRATASHAQVLNPVIEPCLAQALHGTLSQIRRIFPPAAACLDATAAAAAGSRSVNPQTQQQGLTKLGQAILSGASSSTSGRQLLLHMARPRLLLLGAPGAGQQQLSAAVLAALEGLPVHCIGLTSLLANVSARCVEEALVSAFTEARRAAPAVIYWPQAHLWWAAAGSGLRCALVALLDDLPADMPLLLLATAELPADEPAAAGSSRRLLTGPTGPAEEAAGSSRAVISSCSQQEHLEELGLDPTLAALFPPLGQLSDLAAILQHMQQHGSNGEPQLGTSTAEHQQAQHQQQQQEVSQSSLAAAPGSDVLGWVLLGKPASAERRKMFQGIFDAAAAPPEPTGDALGQQPPQPLPPAPDAAAAAEAQRKAAEAAAARVAYEEDQAVLRSLRMILRGIVQRALMLKRYRLFAEPPMLDDEEGVLALQSLSCPMDLLTMLYKVDHQQYTTPAAFLADAHLIVKCAEELYGQHDDAPAVRATAGLTAAAAAAAGGGGGHGVVPAAATGPPGHSTAIHDQGIQAAGTGVDGPAAAAAAAVGAGAGYDQPQEPVLPAVRVTVCKEISRAMELKDGLEQQVYQLVPPDLMQACEAIAAKGGPAPPPPGLVLPQQLLAAKLPAAGQAHGADARGKSTRTTARLAGQKLDRRLLHADPEALMRARKQHKSKAAAAAQLAAPAADTTTAADPADAGAGPLPTQQEQQAQAVAGDDGQVDLTDAAADACDAGQAAAAATAAAAAAAAAGGSEAAAELNQLQQESPAALKPVTNAVGLKRPAPSTADGDACSAEPPAKVARVSAGAAAAHAAGLGPHAGWGSGLLQEQEIEVSRHGDQPNQQEQAELQQQQQQQGQQLQEDDDSGQSMEQDQQQPAQPDLLQPLDPVLVPARQAAAEADVQAAAQLLDRVVAASEGLQLSALELLHARLSRVVAAHAQEQDRSAVLQQLSRVVAGVERERQ